MPEEFDVVVIGGGPAGENAAAGAAAGGLSTVIIEGERLGGECSFWARVPSKAMLRPPDVYGTALGTPGVRPAIHGDVDAAAVFRFRDTMVQNLDDSSQADWVKSVNVALIRGHARFIGPRRLAVVDAAGREKEVTARKAVVVAVGTRTAMPDIPGLRDAKPWTNRDATGKKKAPRRLITLGGGPVALEMAQAWRALGTEEVTIVERGARILKRFEPFACDWITAAFRQQGFDLRLRTQLKRVQRDSSGEITATLDSGATLQADELLVAAGRITATDDLGLETIGLKPGRPITVDDSLRAVDVKEGWLYAVGDANGRNLLTHMGKYQGRILGHVLNGRPATAWADHTVTPQIIFTQPQVASVGLTEAAARERGLPVRAVQVALEAVEGYAMYGPGWRGIGQIVVDTARHVIVGSTLIGLEVGDMLHVATVAIAGEVPRDRLWHAVPSFPSASEIWLRLLEKWAATD
jgi:dihydrolipoamide dehydrogenase